MPRLQDLIYRLEEGGGKIWLRIGAAALALALIALVYNWLCFNNMATQEAMDNAQLGRNIAEGKGFTTLFVRPFSMRLLQNSAAKNPTPRGPLDAPDPTRIKEPHPDISNAPVYPFILAAVMKVLPFDYRVDLVHRFWSASNNHPSADSDQTSKAGRFRRYQPDFIISAFNQSLLLMVAAINFFTARRLFDARIAVFSTTLVLGTDLLWRFAVSGLATILLLLIFSCLLWVLIRLEEKTRQADGGNPPEAAGHNGPEQGPGISTA